MKQQTQTPDTTKQSYVEPVNEMEQNCVIDKDVKRMQAINAGKWFQVYDRSDPDTILFEGSRTKCIKWAKENTPVQYKYRTVRIGKLIWEKL